MTKIKTKSVIGIEAAAVAAAVAAASFESTKPQRPDLPCSLSAFFPLCRLAWGYCRDHIGVFATDSPRFTEIFIDQQLAKVITVENLPNVETRRAAATTAYNQLKADAQAIKMLCQKLKTYIEYAYNSDAAQAVAALKEAGIWTYSEMGNKWKDIDTMIISAKNYMRDNVNTLTAGNNMPPEFPLAFETTGVTFTNSWNNFIAKEAAIQDGTGSQEDGIRDILAELRPMLKTGRRLFIFNPVQRRKFTISRLKYEVQGHLHGGVGGTVRVAGKNKRLANVTVSTTVEGDLRSVVTDEKGKYKLGLPAGTYDIRYEAADFETYILKDKVVKPGITARPKVNLQPLPPPPDASMLEKAVTEMQEQVKQMPDTTVSESNGLHFLDTASPGL